MHDHNEKLLIKKIEKVQNTSVIGMISDAGSPLISDPGYKLVKNFIDKNLFVTSIPGATSFVPALQLSGQPLQSFAFYGFPPKTKKSIKLLANKFISTGLTSLFFISGNKIVEFLEIIASVDNLAKIALCKELTKINETIIRSTVESAIIDIKNSKINLKGEFVLVISSTKNKEKLTIDNNVKIQISHLLKKYSLTETVEIVHKLSNISKKNIYQVALLIKNA